MLPSLDTLTDDPVMLHGNGHSTTLVPTDSVATDTSCCTMDQEPTVDDHEPQHLSKDPVILCGDDICGSLAPTEPAAADTGCPPWIKSQQLSTISHRFLRILCCCPKRMLPFRIVSTILDDLLTIYAIYYNYNFISFLVSTNTSVDFGILTRVVQLPSEWQWDSKAQSCYTMIQSEKEFVQKIVLITTLLLTFVINGREFIFPFLNNKRLTTGDLQRALYEFDTLHPCPGMMDPAL